MAIPFRSRGAVPYIRRSFSLLVRQLFDGLVIGEQVKLTLRCIVAQTQLEVPIRLHSSRCAVRKQIPFTRQQRGFSISEACGDGLTQFGAVVHYEVGAFSSEGQRQVWTSIKSRAGAHSISGSLNH